MAGAKKTKCRKAASPRARSANFRTVFESLKRILVRYQDKMFVKVDQPDAYFLETHSTGTKGERLFFGAAQINRDYVSFYLTPVYAFPELLKGISAGLRKRLRDDSCFNFTAADKRLFDELAQLTEAGFQQYKIHGLL